MEEKISLCHPLETSSLRECGFVLILRPLHEKIGVDTAIGFRASQRGFGTTGAAALAWALTLSAARLGQTEIVSRYVRQVPGPAQDRSPVQFNSGDNRRGGVPCFDRARIVHAAWGAELGDQHVGGIFP